MSNFLVFAGNVCRHTTKALHRTIDTKTNWRSKIVLNSHSIHELQFWVKEAKKLNATFFEFKPSVATKLVYSDACSTGCAAYISVNDNPMFYRNWDANEMAHSSAWRELLWRVLSLC